MNSQVFEALSVGCVASWPGFCAVSGKPSGYSYASRDKDYFQTAEVGPAISCDSPVGFLLFICLLACYLNPGKFELEKPVA